MASQRVVENGNCSDQQMHGKRKEVDTPTAERPEKKMMQEIGGSHESFPPLEMRLPSQKMLQQPLEAETTQQPIEMRISSVVAVTQRHSLNKRKQQQWPINCKEPKIPSITTLVAQHLQQSSAIEGTLPSPTVQTTLFLKADGRPEEYRRLVILYKAKEEVYKGKIVDNNNEEGAFSFTCRNRREMDCFADQLTELMSRDGYIRVNPECKEYQEPADHDLTRRRVGPSNNFQQSETTAIHATAPGLVSYANASQPLQISGLVANSQQEIAHPATTTQWQPAEHDLTRSEVGPSNDHLQLSATMATTSAAPSFASYVNASQQFQISGPVANTQQGIDHPAPQWQPAHQQNGATLAPSSAWNNGSISSVQQGLQNGAASSYVQQQQQQEACLTSPGTASGFVQQQQQQGLQYGAASVHQKQTQAFLTSPGAASGIASYHNAMPIMHLSRPVMHFPQPMHPSSSSQRPGPTWNAGSSSSAQPQLQAGRQAMNPGLGFGSSSSLPPHPRPQQLPQYFNPPQQQAAPVNIPPIQISLDNPWMLIVASTHLVRRPFLLPYLTNTGIRSGRPIPLPFLPPNAVVPIRLPVVMSNEVAATILTMACYMSDSGELMEMLPDLLANDN